MKFSNFIPPIFSRKASKVVSIIARNGKILSFWRPDRFEQYAEEGYQKSVTAYSCVNEISKSVAGIHWVVKKKARTKNSREQVIDDHPLLDLLGRPNDLESGHSLIESFMALLLISGNSYMEKVGPDSGPPLELYVHRPDRMTVIPDRTNMIAGYKYKVNEQTVHFVKGEILHKKLFNPLDDWYGLSPLKVAAMDVDSETEAKRWNLSLLKNDMRPPGAFVASEELSPTQFKRMQDQVAAKYAGAGNAGKPLLLEKIDWKEFAISQKDSDWINGRKMSKREIAQAYQVPPELIGDGENKTYSNYKEARKSFYTETVIPHMDGLKGDFNGWLAPLYEDRIFLDYDKKLIDAIQADQNELYKRVNDANHLTVNEKRLLTGQGEVIGGDVILVRVGMVALDAITDGNED